MRRLVLPLIVALLGLTAVLNGVYAAEMATGMAMAAHGGAPPCDGCGEAGGDLAGCATACVPASAPPSSLCFQIDLLSEARPGSAFHWAKLPSGPPDPHPPRF